MKFRITVEAEGNDPALLRRVLAALENGSGERSARDEVTAPASDVQRRWRHFMDTRDATALKIYEAFEQVGDDEVTLAQLEEMTGIRPLGAKLGGQTLSGRSILGEPPFLVVAEGRYRRNAAVWPTSA